MVSGTNVFTAKHKPKFLVTRCNIVVANFSFKNQNEENAFGTAVAIFLLTSKIKYKHAHYLSTYPWKTTMNEILPNTCQDNVFESYLGCWGCLLAVNLLIYLETSSPQ